MILRDMNGVVQRLARHGHHGQNIVLRRIRRNVQTVKMEVGHIHARRNGAGTLRFGRQVIHIVDLQHIARRESQDWCDVMAVVGKSVPTVWVGYGEESEGKLMIVRTQFRRFRKWRCLVSFRKHENEATQDKNSDSEHQNAVHRYSSYSFEGENRLIVVIPAIEDWRRFRRSDDSSYTVRTCPPARPGRFSRAARRLGLRSWAGNHVLPLTPDPGWAGNRSPL